MNAISTSATLLLLLSVAGCGGAPMAPSPSPSPSPTPARDSVNSITNMSPAVGTALQPGQTVTFAGTAGYTLATADLGAVVMVLQDQADRPLPISGAQQTVVVHRGTSEVGLVQTATIPSDGVTAVRVYFMLAAAGAPSTTAVLMVSYPVR